MNRPLFKLGQILATPGALSRLADAGQTALELIVLHVAGNWGVVDSEDAEANKEALKDGSRLLSAYLLKDEAKTKVWIITEAEDSNGNRAATTLLLPEEY